MGYSLIWYLKEFARVEWIKKFLFAKTAPLSAPSYFRGFPELTGETCQHALFCMMACPAPGAIEVLHAGMAGHQESTKVIVSAAGSVSRPALTVC
jgi:hypothetical protein